MARLRDASGKRDPLARLTPHERSVLELIGEGLTNRQIGERLFIAEKTVKNYVSTLFRKLGLKQRTAAAAYAARTFSGRRSNRARTCGASTGTLEPNGMRRRTPGSAEPTARFRVSSCMRKYVIMGIQGSGKGTHAKMLAEDFDLDHIAVGDIFRWNVQHHTKLGAQVRRTMAAGCWSATTWSRASWGTAQRARLELRLHHRRLPAQRAPGGVLPGELRHRRGDPPRPARQRGGAPGARPAAVRELRDGLQPARPQPVQRAGGATSAAAS